MTVIQTLLMVRPTYARRATLLHTSSNPPHFTPETGYSHVAYNGVVWLTQFPSSSYTGAELYGFATQNAPLVQKTGLSPQRYCVGGAYGESSPPGYGVYKEAYGGHNLYRINVDGVWEYVTNSGLASMDRELVWSHSAQALFGSPSFGGTMVKVSSLDWALHTCSIDTTTYNTSGYAITRPMLNGGLIDGRLYVWNSMAGGIGWLDVASGGFTSVTTYANASVWPILCSPDYLGSSALIACQCGATGEGNIVDLWDTAGTRVGRITLPESATAYSYMRFTYDYVNNFLWVHVSGGKIYVCNLSTLAVFDTFTSSDLPDGINYQMLNALGAHDGGIYIISRPFGGASYNSVYKLG